MTVLTPIKAIRAKCLDCMCGNSAEVRRCPCEDCSLFPYRMGHRPKNATCVGENEEEGEGDIDILPEDETS